MPIETVMIDALDGVQLQADLVRVDRPTGAVVLTHPHPLYGGDRFNPLVDTLFALLPDSGFSTIRFDFRGVNSSTGTHDDGDSERLDVLAAVELLEFVDPDVDIWLVGYSFGSLVALNVMDPRVAGWVAIAPPLAGVTGRILAADDHRPKLLVTPRHDQFSSPEATAAIAAEWTATELRVVESTDHFLGGRVRAIAEDVTASLTGRLTQQLR